MWLNHGRRVCVFAHLRGPFRYKYEHAICKRPLTWDGRVLPPGRRLSLIFRERQPPQPLPPQP